MCATVVFGKSGEEGKEGANAVNSGGGSGLVGQSVSLRRCPAGRQLTVARCRLRNEFSPSTINLSTAPINISLDPQLIRTRPAYVASLDRSSFRPFALYVTDFSPAAR